MKIYGINSFNYATSAINRNITFKNVNDWFDEDEPDYWGSVGRHHIRNTIYQEMFGISIREKTDKKKLATKLEDTEDITNFHILGNMSYSGASLIHYPDYFKLLEKAGVEKVIDLVNNSVLAGYCEQYKLQYCVFDNLDLQNGKHSIFQDKNSLISTQTEKLSKQGLLKKEFDIAMGNYIDTVNSENTQYIYDLKTLIDLVNNGRFYMSCDWGCRTNNCLSLITLFNPKWIGEKYTPTKQFTNKVANMYNNLTSEHKQILEMCDGDCLNLKNQILKFANK